MDSLILDQKFGDNWAAYNGDCVMVMRNLPDNSIDFNVHSPPFTSLYIYSDSIADLGNTESEAQFFEGYRFAIAEMYRTLKPGRSVAVHCKDTMRYMSTHTYSGLYDFPGDIINAFEAEGFKFGRWITIWKDPVVEMQRTKTYGLLHTSFAKRAEVVRQGCADYVLVFTKPGDDYHDEIDRLPEFNQAVLDRINHIWSMDGEEVGFNEPAKHLTTWSKPLEFYTSEFIDDLSGIVETGRLTVVHCTKHTMTPIIKKFEIQGAWKFHSRCALTDGSFLVTFRNWNGEVEAGAVQHNLIPPEVHYKNGDLSKLNGYHPDYVGNQPPTGYNYLRSGDSYYSILVWQRYASPVWFDLESLPDHHSDIWMDINQTDVLNARIVKKDEENEKHICPLQLDLIERLVLQYTQPNEIVLSPYGGIGSEGYQALRVGRKAILAELKPTYFLHMVKNLKELELSLTQVDLFSFAGVSVEAI